jgi:hypothetical protein
MRALGEPEVWVGHETTWTALAGGDYADWLNQLQAWLPTLPPRDAADFRIISALFLGAPADSEVAAAARYLAALQGGQQPPISVKDLLDAKCWLAQWRLAQGREAGSDAVIRQLRQSTLPYTQCTALLELALAEHRRGDVRSAALRLDSISRGLGAGVGSGFYGMGNLVLARTFLRLGDPGRALAAARRRCYGLFCDGIVIPSQRLAEARAAVEVGDTLAAVRAFDEYLSLRSHADGAWRGEADSARAERAQLIKR